MTTPQGLNRMAVWISNPVHSWLVDESSRLGISTSAYVRLILTRVYASNVSRRVA